jgi:hypothetical protein
VNPPVERERRERGGGRERGLNTNMVFTRMNLLMI